MYLKSVCSPAEGFAVQKKMGHGSTTNKDRISFINILAYDNEEMTIHPSIFY